MTKHGKKWIGLAASVLLCLSFVVGVKAAEATKTVGDLGTNGYTVTIPATLDTTSGSGTLTVSGQMQRSSSLTIGISSKNSYNLVYDSGSATADDTLPKVAYTLTGAAGTTLTDGTENSEEAGKKFLSHVTNADEESFTDTLNVTLTDPENSATMSGTYSDTLTFEMEYTTASKTYTFRVFYENTDGTFPDTPGETFTRVLWPGTSFKWTRPGSSEAHDSDRWQITTFTVNRLSNITDTYDIKVYRKLYSFDINTHYFKASDYQGNESNLHEDTTNGGWNCWSDQLWGKVTMYFCGNEKDWDNNKDSITDKVTAADYNRNGIVDLRYESWCILDDFTLSDAYKDNYEITGYTVGTYNEKNASLIPNKGKTANGNPVYGPIKIQVTKNLGIYWGLKRTTETGETVILDPNTEKGGSGDQITNYNGIRLPGVGAFTNTTDPNLKFAGWSTTKTASSSSKIYPEGTVVSTITDWPPNSTDHILYAQWGYPCTVKMRYETATGGWYNDNELPDKANAEETVVVVPDMTYTWTRKRTMDNDSKIWKNASYTFKITSSVQSISCDVKRQEYNLKLYALYKDVADTAAEANISKYATAKVKINDGALEDVTTSYTKSQRYGTTYEFSDVTAKQGYQFTGWHINYNGQGKGTYLPTKPITGTVTGKAYIENGKTTYEDRVYLEFEPVQVTYNPNVSDVATTVVVTDSTGKVMDTGGWDIAWDELTESNALPELVRDDGYLFESWYASAAGTKDTKLETLEELKTLIKNSNITIYARWKEGGTKVTLNANDGTANVATSTGTYDVLPQCSFTAPEGKEFAGWSTSATINSNDDLLQPGTAVANIDRWDTEENKTLYAQWGYRCKVTVAYEKVDGTTYEDAVEEYNKVLLPGTTDTWTSQHINDANGKQWDATNATYTFNSVSAEETKNVQINRKRYMLDLNGYLGGSRGKLAVDDTDSAEVIATADIWINGVQVETGKSDYCTSHPYGTKYEIKLTLENKDYEFLGWYVSNGEDKTGVPELTSNMVKATTSEDGLTIKETVTGKFWLDDATGWKESVWAAFRKKTTGTTSDADESTDDTSTTTTTPDTTPADDAGEADDDIITPVPGDDAADDTTDDTTTDTTEPQSIKLTLNGDGTDTDEVTLDPNGELPKCTFTAPEGTQFVGWTTSEQKVISDAEFGVATQSAELDGLTVYAAGTPVADVQWPGDGTHTLYALWRENVLTIAYYPYGDAAYWMPAQYSLSAYDADDWETYAVAVGLADEPVETERVTYNGTYDTARSTAEDAETGLLSAQRFRWLVDGELVSKAGTTWSVNDPYGGRQVTLVPEDTDGEPLSTFTGWTGAELAAYLSAADDILNALKETDVEVRLYPLCATSEDFTTLPILRPTDGLPIEISPDPIYDDIHSGDTTDEPSSDDDLFDDTEEPALDDPTLDDEEPEDPDDLTDPDDAADDADTTGKDTDSDGTDADADRTTGSTSDPDAADEDAGSSSAKDADDADTSSSSSKSDTSSSAKDADDDDADTTSGSSTKADTASTDKAAADTADDDAANPSSGPDDAADDDTSTEPDETSDDEDAKSDASADDADATDTSGGLTTLELMESSMNIVYPPDDLAFYDADFGYDLYV